MEIWKDIKGYEGRYQVSNLGRVKNIKSGRVLKQDIHKQGYIHYRLNINTKQKTFKAHRLVAEAFIPNPENKPQVNHIDGDKINNRLENLEWCTAAENIQHAVNNKLRVAAKGEKHGKSKLSKKDVLEIRSSTLSIIELSIMYNIHKGTIRRIINKKIWKHI